MRSPLTPCAVAVLRVSMRASVLCWNSLRTNGHSELCIFPSRAAGLFNSMIAPLTTTRLKAVLWVQGEANAHITPNASSRSVVPPPLEYACAFAAMLQGWRTAFRQPNLPAVYAQLRPYCNGVLYCGLSHAATSEREIALPLIREAQLRVVAALRNTTAMVVAADLGDTMFPLGPAGQIHSRLKGPVTDRMAAAVLGLAYNHDVPFRSPTPTSAEAIHSYNTTTSVRINLVDAGQGLLQVRSGSCPVARGPKSNSTVPYQPIFCNSTIGFEAQVDGVWRPATSVTPGHTSITISVGIGGTVTAVRYAFMDWPIISVYTSQGLPLSPFGELAVSDQSRGPP
jgi:sialate O-acetylesterase